METGPKSLALYNPVRPRGRAPGPEYVDTLPCAEHPHGSWSWTQRHGSTIAVGRDA